MTRAIALLVLEFWVAIIAFVPAVVAGGWLLFRNYLAAQNDFLLEYKPTIDTVALFVAIGSLIVGYLSLMREIEKLKEEKAKVAAPPAQVQKFYKTKGDGNVNLRPCPKPTSECPPLTELPPSTPVHFLGDSQPYVDTTGTRSIWRKVRTTYGVGWLNDNTLWEY